MTDVLEEIKRMGFDAVMAENLFEIVRITREAAIEECARVAVAQKQEFLSPQYAANQPFGSICERFACDEVAKAIRALVEGSGER